ncbi:MULTISPECIES: hypothetical protein [Roseobacteraceae]|uniref:hypothetical protein n=1 Tax=Roseobacteraceae TaxID=2854170 RepID=UPI004058B2C9
MSGEPAGGTRAALAMPSFDDLDDFAPRGGSRKSQESGTSRKSGESGGSRTGENPGAAGQADMQDPEGQGEAVTETVPAEAPRRKSRPAEAPVAARHIPSAAETRRAIDAVSHFPSREAATDGQLNLKGPRHVLDRFRAMCKADRRAYYDMLEILMDQFEGRTPQG